MYRKAKIPKALREQVWISKFGKKFESKCFTPWCKNTITVFDFQCGHDIPESKGGKTDISNLYPICSRCNMSMSNVYTLEQWCRKGDSGVSIVDVKRTYCLPVLCYPRWTLFGTKVSGMPSAPSHTNPKNKPIK